ncbi:hexosaminidase [Microbacterium resistens]|uniref:beta-N-acetylhexosaminidase n=1 Tax=Microbacterium resistens TaxID=156977 RepID=A0ABU1SH84_9MICO|nr:beta-N-acetylhexosaminidase [Microbacterium resistens]MDR6868959.1 hexosaminidase [Microbacterium resistens]
MVLPDHLPLVPHPSSVRRGEGALALDGARIVGVPAIAAQLAADITARTGRPHLVTDTAGDTDASPTDATPGDIVLAIDPAVSSPEGYLLSVTDRVSLTGHDAAGLYYATRTLLQLLREHDGDWTIPLVEIEDAPRFGYRGVMLDVARHFFAVADVERYIDSAADLKFNALHLHLTDDQGWRIHIDAWPLLSERASTTSANGDSGGFYSTDDYRGLVAYAAARHMIIVPEIDLPGHTHAVGTAYPDLVEEPVMNDALLADAARLGQALPVHGLPYTGWGVGHSSVRIGEERTDDFVRDVITEIAALTPGPYLHIGGDESLGTTAEDFASFVERVSALVVETGKTPVAWHEAGSAPGIATGTVGQYWGSTAPQGSHAEEARRFVERGGALIMSPSNVAYLDMKYSADYPLGLSWAGLVTLRDAYGWEPTTIIGGVPASAILGVEAPLWTETVHSLADADRLTFPRAAAHAEIAWTSQDAPERTWDSFRTRVSGLAPAWKTAGIDFHPTEEIAWPTA